MTIRSHLFLLALAAAVPVLAFALVACVVLIRTEQRTQQIGALDRARAMMTAVDAELRGSIATLQVVAASRTLDTKDFAAFQVFARRALDTQPTWLNVTLSHPSGAQAVNVKAGPAATSLPQGDLPNVRRVVADGVPVVGDVVLDEVNGGPGVPVHVPVRRNGAVAYVLTAIVRADSFMQLIRQQHLPDRWVSGIVDGQRRFIARSPPAPVGGLSSENFRAAVGHAREGWYRGLTIEGADMFTAHKTSDFTGWAIGLAIPRATVEAAAQRSVWFMLAGSAISIGLAFAVGIIVGRRIEQPIRSLASEARSIGSGVDPRFAHVERVREVSEVATALRDAAAAVRERQQLLEREKEALKTADVAKDEFLAMLSHELRNPLAAMNTAAHVMKVADPRDSAASHARLVMERQTRHMTRLIEDLLDVSRIAMGKVVLEKAPLELGEIASHVVDAWRSSGRLDRHQVELNASPVWIEGDRARVEQIVSNLLDNAVKFTRAGGRITVTVGDDGGGAELRISDEGEGIDPELVGRVFDLFVQGAHGIDRSKGGMGIGLALVKRLAELHGGTVAAASRGRGQGATFTVRFAASQPREVSRAAPSTRAAGAPRRILIIEDNDDAREMLREALVLDGHEVSVARDGQSGLGIAEQTQPEVALVDIGLPDMDGYEVARRLRAARNGSMLIVALTGYGQPEDRRRALDAGFDVHMTKPVEAERLDAVLASYGDARGKPGTRGSA